MSSTVKDIDPQAAKDALLEEVRIRYFAYYNAWAMGVSDDTLKRARIESRQVEASAQRIWRALTGETLDTRPAEAEAFEEVQEAVKRRDGV